MYEPYYSLLGVVCALICIYGAWRYWLALQREKKLKERLAEYDSDVERLTVNNGKHIDTILSQARDLEELHVQFRAIKQAQSHRLEGVFKRMEEADCRARSAEAELRELTERYSQTAITVADLLHDMEAADKLIDQARNFLRLPWTPEDPDAGAVAQLELRFFDPGENEAIITIEHGTHDPDPYAINPALAGWQTHTETVAVDNPGDSPAEPPSPPASGEDPGHGTLLSAA